VKENSIKVLYIAGPTRSGSTLLSKILGEVEGFFNAGEIIDIWDRGLTSDGLCSCGKPMSQCDIWEETIDRSFPSKTNKDIQEMINIRDKLAHSSYILPLIFMSPERLNKYTSHGEYFEKLEKLYQGIKSATGASVIIDSSKNVGYAFMLAMAPKIDLYILHTIRDARATSYSWLRKKEGLWQTNPFESSVVWNLRNISTEIMVKKMNQKTLRVYYEKFVEEPQKIVKNILNFIDEESDSLPFIDRYQILLNESHSIYGNPNRFQTGKVKIKMDDRWKREMKYSHKLLVTFLTWPLLARYGYLIPSQS
jgi:hypothetical protein